jgi:anthranilate synthase component 1
MNRFEAEKPADKSAQLAQGFYGYATYDAVQFFETIKIKSYTTTPEIPVMRYRLYQYVIVINHFKDEMYLCENMIDGIESDISAVESLIKSKDVPAYPFKIQFDEVSNISDDGYIQMVKKGIASCLRG